MRRPVSIWCSLLVLALAAACTDNITAPTAPATRPVLAVSAAAAADPVSFCNPASITIRDANSAVPYPSTIVVSGVSSGPFRITATLNGFNHTVLADVDILLVGPGGQTVMLMSDAGGSADFQNATVTFDDAASGPLPLGITGVLPGGSFRPTNPDAPDFMPSGAPAEPYGSSLAVFAGTDANGTWRLYARDDLVFGGAGNGSIARGWCVTVISLNSPPLANAGGPYTGAEGSPIHFDGSGSADPDADIVSYAWDFGDGETGSAATVDHTYANSGAYAVTLVVTDDDGATSQATTTATISDVAPTATFTAPTEVSEGSDATISLTSPSAGGARYAFDCGGGYGPIGTASDAACQAADNGVMTVKGRVIDATIDDLFSEYTAEINVTNVAPTATFANNGPVSEGAPIQLQLAEPVDVAADLAVGLTYAFDCGPGYGTPSAVSTASCPTTDNGDAQVKGKVIDKDGGETEYTATVGVSNVAPVVTSLALPSGPVAVNTPVTLCASFTDSGADDTHTGSFELGAGGPVVPGSVVETNGSGSMSATVTFPQAGVYTIVARVTDDDGGSDSRSSELTIIVADDPTTSSVAGTGLFSSPAGALIDNPSFAGRAAFAFGAKYMDGGTTLAAHLEFVIKAANFHFRSTKHESLTIDGGQARYRGEGTVNGVGSYGFQVTAIDGGLIGMGWERLTANDKIRVRIWNTSTGAVVYDNQAQAPESSDAASPLTGGGIVILNR